MKRSTAVFIQGVIVLWGIAVLAFMLWEPQIEGRNAHATTFEIYFQDPFLAYAYIASTPFFIALYQASKVLRYPMQGRAFSQPAVTSMRTIKHCAIALIGFVVLGMIFILIGPSDDRPPGIFMGLLATSGSTAIAIAAAKLERTLQAAVDRNR